MTVDAATRAALVKHARLAIKVGSHSFSAASQLFDNETRERAWLLYAWCRRAHDIADNQDMGGVLGDQSDLGQRLALIRRLTALAFEGKPTGDPAFDALGVVAAECGLTPAMAEDVGGGRRHRSVAIGHAHIDTAWLSPIRETKRKCVRTFASAVALMDDYPEYVFAASSAQHYTWIEERHPELFTKITERVERGQWEPVGGMWVEADMSRMAMSLRL